MEEFYLSQYYEWKQSPVTRALLAALKEYRQGKIEDIAEGKALELSDLYQEIGRAQGIADSIEFILTDLSRQAIRDGEEDAQGRRISNLSKT
jgi:uncharacterized phage-associated protein